MAITLQETLKPFNPCKFRDVGTHLSQLVIGQSSKVENLVLTYPTLAAMVPWQEETERLDNLLVLRTSG